MISQVATVIAALFASGVALQLLLPVKKEDYTGQHVVVTGGSQGMGKGVARQFVRRGANVTIIARTQATLDSALVELKSEASKSQTIRARSVDCTDSSAIIEAFEELGTPDVLFCCAGRTTFPKPCHHTDQSRHGTPRLVCGNVSGGSRQADDWQLSIIYVHGTCSTYFNAQKSSKSRVAPEKDRLHKFHSCISQSCRVYSLHTNKGRYSGAG